MRQKQHGECSVIPDKSYRMHPENNQAATLGPRTKGQAGLFGAQTSSCGEYVTSYCAPLLLATVPW